MKKETKITSISIPAHLHGKVAAIAYSEGRSFSAQAAYFLAYAVSQLDTALPARDPRSRKANSRTVLAKGRRSA